MTANHNVSMWPVITCPWVAGFARPPTALVKFLESKGIQVMAEGLGRVRTTYIELFNEKIEFGIKESTNKHEVEPSSKADWHRRTFRYEPNGKLYFFIGGYGGNLRRTYADSTRRKLGDLVNEFILGLVKVADYEKRQRIEREERNRRWEEERRRTRQIQEAIEQEQQRQKTLKELTKLWIHSDQVRQFIAAAEAKAAQLKLSRADSRRFELWKIWANGHADSLDPLSKGLPHELKVVNRTKPRQFHGYQW